MPLADGLTLRLATLEDISAINKLVDISVRALCSKDYTPNQLDVSLKYVFACDTQLIKDHTYYVVSTDDGTVVGAGGWGKRATLYGGDNAAQQREDRLLDPRTENSRLRAFYVHPDWARKGIATAIVQESEAAARADGFTTMQIVSTLTGVKLYQSQGYTVLNTELTKLPNGDDWLLTNLKKAL
eukprot:TRINITY_DN115226_c0_g1_i1.p1 TRINITY_DN115226_c0_g1~~TRINITY_DN115226_c0_g1_i1.p1  ORF type:complete len:184 (-),score=15.18 TRINITY_DN115226_c0_g1_i1:69-620(-)